MRVATIPFQQSMRSAIQVSQAKLASTEQQIATGKKAQDLAGLGSDAVRTLSARSLLSTQQAQASATKQLGTTLSLYDTNITNIDTAGSDLKTTLMTVVGNGKGAGLQGSIEAAFEQFRSALNATDGSEPLFAGSQTDRQPFTPGTLADTVGATPATAFTNDQVKSTVRAGHGLDVTYGVVASDIGSGMLSVFRTLAEAGPFGDTPTPAQLSALQDAVGQLDTALPQVRAVNAGNGLRQSQVETLGTRADDRATLLTKLIADNEEADYGELATALDQQKLALQASYSVFSQLAGLSLANYLK